jgi:hypothetical protein
MKRIALVVAAGSLLAAPVVFAQTASQSSLPPSAATAESSSRDTGSHVPPSDVALPRLKNRAQNTGIPRDASTVTGSFEDGPQSTVTGSFKDEDGHESTVTGSLLDAESGSN